MSKIKLFNTLPSSMVSSQNLFVNDYDVVSFKRYTEDELYKEYFLDNILVFIMNENLRSKVLNVRS